MARKLFLPERLINGYGQVTLIPLFFQELGQTTFGDMIADLVADETTPPIARWVTVEGMVTGEAALRTPQFIYYKRLNSK